jgi:7,8-dihydroneopterin aldolase/epimerase/oxygenase
MDIIYLHNMRVETVIGVWEWERRIRQSLIVDIDLGTDVTRAGETDVIEDTVDYKAVSDRVMAISSNSEFHLIEALAARIAQTLLEEFNVQWIRVRINKQGVVRHVRDIGVIIERSRSD